MSSGWPSRSSGTNRPKYNEGVIRCQSGLGEWFRTAQRGVKSLKNQLYGFVSLSCVEEVMGPNSVQQHGMLSLCLIGKSTPCEHVALHNSFAILGPRWGCFGFSHLGIDCSISTPLRHLPRVLSDQ